MEWLQRKHSLSSCTSCFGGPLQWLGNWCRNENFIPYSFHPALEPPRPSSGMVFLIQLQPQKFLFTLLGTMFCIMLWCIFHCQQWLWQPSIKLSIFHVFSENIFLRTGIFHLYVHVEMFAGRARYTVHSHTKAKPTHTSLHLLPRIYQHVPQWDTSVCLQGPKLSSSESN